MNFIHAQYTQSTELFYYRGSCTEKNSFIRKKKKKKNAKEPAKSPQQFPNQEKKDMKQTKTKINT